MRIENGFYIFNKTENEWMGKWFKSKEFRCSCDYESCPEQKISVELIQRLEFIRESCNSPIRVHSGFRCNKKQEDIRKSNISTVVAKNKSTHEMGEAVDISCSALVPGELMKFCELKFKSIGIANNFLHVDLRDDKIRRWNY